MRITQRIRHRVFERANGKCSVCGRSDVPLEIDHILPRSRGGGDDVTNLRAVCRSCNVLMSQTHETRQATLEEAASRGYQFERLIHQRFRELGFAVVSGATGPDGGADLIVRHVDPVLDKTVTYIVQCKYTRGSIQPDAIAQLAVTKEHTGADYALLISNKRATAATLDLARRFGISVLSPDELTERVAGMNRITDDG